MHSLIEQYYNKFNEEKRLLSRHGQVEFLVSMKYIHECIQECTQRLNVPKNEIRIIDIGAGTGRYSVTLAEEGYIVTAVELVKYNLGILKSKNAQVNAYQGNAMNLKRFEDESFEITILFGPMYHLSSHEDKLKALNEAKRVTKAGGYILVAYCMNEYSVLTYGFKQNNINQCLQNGKIDENYKVIAGNDDLYDYVRLEEINKLNTETGLTRIKIISPDGPSDYMRPVINAMDEDTFKSFIDYQMKVCERPELIGAGSHTVDILIKG